MHKTPEEFLRVPLMHSSLAAVEICIYLQISCNMLLCNNIFQKLEQLYNTDLASTSNSSSCIVICFQFSVNDSYAWYWVVTYWVIFTCSSQHILVILIGMKQTQCFSFFIFCLFVGNSWCWAERTFWPLLLYFFNQSFIMTIIEVIVATFVIKCIIWCQCLDNSRTLTNPG